MLYPQKMANRSSIAISFKGKGYVGEYEVSGRVLRVFFEGQTKVGLLRGSDADLMARILFIELVSEVDAAKNSKRIATKKF